MSINRIPRTTSKIYTGRASQPLNHLGRAMREIVYPEFEMKGRKPEFVPVRPPLASR